MGRREDEGRLTTEWRGLKKRGWKGLRIGLSGMEKRIRKGADTKWSGLKKRRWKGADN